MKSSENGPHKALYVVIFYINYCFVCIQPEISRNVTGRTQWFVRRHMQIQFYDFSDRPPRTLTDKFFDLPFYNVCSSIVLFFFIFFVKCYLNGTLKRSYEFDFVAFFIVFDQFDNQGHIPLDGVVFFQFPFQLDFRFFFCICESGQRVTLRLRCEK